MNKKQRSKLLFTCVILVLVLVMLYSGLQILESTVFFEGKGALQTTSKTITRNGVKYYPRQDITVVLVMGINQTGKVEPTEFNHGGAVDMLALLILDKKTEAATVLSLNRDMMVDMPVLNRTGKEVDIFNGQLAYSHTYGDGMEVSCENVRKTVSNLLYGLQIDYYISINMNTISLLNDAVGGVPVTIVDDFSAVTSDLPKGDLVLNGAQAVTYLQTRWDVGDELNLSRMERHKVYINSFAPAFKAKAKKDAEFAVNTYDSITDYIVTDCTLPIFSRLVSDYSEYPLKEILTIEGDNVLKGNYYEFYADEEALDALILKLFYAPKEK